jgi:hypothetical protein
MRVQSRRRKGQIPAGYSLQVETPGKATKAVETFDSMPAAVERAAELIRAGYNIGIWSPVSPENTKEGAHPRCSPYPLY